MKVALFLVSLLACGLAIGWFLDHAKFADAKKQLADQLKEETDDAHTIRENYESLLKQQHNPNSEITSQLNYLQKTLTEKEALLVKMKSDNQDQIQRITTGDYTKYETLQKDYDIAQQNGKANYDEVARWNRLAIAKQQQLNQLWAATRHFYTSDAAAEQALGESLYTAVNKPPSTYAISGNGLFWLDTPNSEVPP